MSGMGMMGKWMRDGKCWRDNGEKGWGDVMWEMVEVKDKIRKEGVVKVGMGKKGVRVGGGLGGSERGGGGGGGVGGGGDGGDVEGWGWGGGGSRGCSGGDGVGEGIII